MFLANSSSNYFVQYKKNFSIEGLIKGCEQLEIMPNPSAIVINKKADVDIKDEGAQQVKGMAGNRNCMALCIRNGFKELLNGVNEIALFPKGFWSCCMQVSQSTSRY